MSMLFVFVVVIGLLLVTEYIYALFDNDVMQARAERAIFRNPNKRGVYTAETMGKVVAFETNTQKRVDIGGTLSFPRIRKYGYNQVSPIVEYMAADGKTYRIRALSTKKKICMPGQTAVVLYDPENPQNAIVRIQE